MNDIQLLGSFEEAECYLYWIYKQDFTDPFTERLYRDFNKPR